MFIDLLVVEERRSSVQNKGQSSRVNNLNHK